jgi:hypothetical protein
MLANLQVGRRYEVETSDREFNGRTYRRITKATPYVAGDGAVAAKAAARTGGNDSVNSNSYRRTDPVDSERMFVCAALTAFITARSSPNSAR